MSKTPWIADKWFVSPFNFAPEVVGGMSLPKQVQIYDVTLRDGEQCPGVVFRREEKVKIAQELDAVGVHRIEAGMPVVSQEDFEAVREIAHLGLKTKVKAFCRARRDDVDTARRCDVWGVLVEIASSRALIEKGFQWTEDKVMNMAVDSALYAKSHGLHVTFFCVDSTRAEIDFLRRLVKAVVEEAKVDAIAIVDTFGVASPWAMALLTKNVSSWVKVPIEVHVHNDLGLATANSLAAVGAGAEVVHTNINGLGERSGGAALEEVAVAVRLVYSVDLGLNYSRLFKLSKTLQGISGIRMSPIKPVVGDQSFAYEAGVPVMFCQRLKEMDSLQIGLPYLPEFVGNRFKVILGKKSGRHSIEAKMKEFSLSLNEAQIEAVLNRVKEDSMRKHGPISDEELLAITKEVMRSSSR